MSRYLNLAKLVFRKKNGSPVYWIHSVTERCNALCAHCFVDTNRAKDELSIEEIRTVCAGLGGDIHVAALTGGEPFLRDDLVEICRAYLELTEAGVVQIATNGLARSRITAMVKEISDLCGTDRLLVINLSLDGVGDLHDRIRSVEGLFEGMMRTYRELEELAESRDNLCVGFNVTVSSLNEDNLGDITRYMSDTVDVENINVTLARGNTREEVASDVTVSKYEEFVDELNDLLRQQKTVGYPNTIHGLVSNAQNILSRERILQTAKHKKFIAPCYAGTLSGVMSSDGNVYPCELRRECFGNVRESSFKEIWSSVRARKFRRDIGDCFCTHECVMIVNVLFNASYWPAIVRECLRMGGQRLASAMGKKIGKNNGCEQKANCRSCSLR